MEGLLIFFGNAFLGAAVWEAIKYIFLRRRRAVRINYALAAIRDKSEQIRRSWGDLKDILHKVLDYYSKPPHLDESDLPPFPNGQVYKRMVSELKALSESLAGDLTRRKDDIQFPSLKEKDEFTKNTEFISAFSRRLTILDECFFKKGIAYAISSRYFVSLYDMYDNQELISRIAADAERVKGLLAFAEKDTLPSLDYFKKTRPFFGSERNLRQS